jgi:hypothetical protein
MSEDAPENRKKNPLANLARVLIGAGLPAIGTAVAGPAGGLIAATVAREVLGTKDAEPDAVASAIASGAAPDALVKLREIEARLTEKQLEAMTAESVEVTKRHEIDMASDSMLSKTVRPGGLWVLVIAFVIFVFIAAFVGALEKSEDFRFYAELLKEAVLWWGSIYVGVRTGERIAPIFTKGGRGE